jgi:hypothetical protein
MKSYNISILLIICIAFYNFLFGQNLIAVQHDGTSAFYTVLDDAITNAMDGDTIYIPGDGFSISIPIGKRIYIVGVGHNPDATLATARTIITGNLTISSGADNGSISGIYFNGGTFYNHGQVYFESDINGYKIERCFISGGISGGANVSNITILENIIGSCNSCPTCSNDFSILLTSPNNSLSYNILLSRVGMSSSTLRNNIFLYYSPFASYPFSLTSNNCTIENNVFNSGLGNNNSNNIFRNNVNGGVNGIYSYCNQGNGNFQYATSLESIFVNYSGWSYSSDMHLIPDSPLQNASTDSTDIGIYGGVLPWKEGSVPFNPHIQYEAIGTTT